MEKWLKSYFLKDEVPEWLCPICKKGRLIMVKEDFHFRETQSSLNAHSEDFWDPEMVDYRFHGTLRCDLCHDFISFLGTGGVQPDYIYYQGQYHKGYSDYFSPTYFLPALDLFPIPQDCPSVVKETLEDSFKLFWNDLPSCANKIRTCLELLMNHQKVKKFLPRKNGKRKDLSLHERLEIFKDNNVDVADFLLAIKWIGNAGSHTGKLRKEDVLDAYKLLNRSLQKLFDKEDEKLKKNIETN